MSTLFKNETFWEVTENDDLSEYKLIPLLTKYTVKADGKHKVIIVAGGHRTGDSGEDVYAGHIKGKSVRIIFLIASRNDLKLLMGDVTAAYLYALTKKKVYTKAGKEFGKYAGKLLIIHKALYEL